MNYVSYAFCLDNEKFILANKDTILIYKINENNFIFKKKLSINNDCLFQNIFHIYKCLILDKGNQCILYEIKKPYNQTNITGFSYLCMCEYLKKNQIIFFTHDLFFIFYDLSLKSIKLKKQSPIINLISSMKYYNNNKICMFSHHHKIFILDINNFQVETILNIIYLYNGIFLNDNTFLFIGNKSMIRININDYEIIEKIDFNKTFRNNILNEFGNKYIVFRNKWENMFMGILNY